MLIFHLFSTFSNYRTHGEKISVTKIFRYLEVSPHTYSMWVFFRVFKTLSQIVSVSNYTVVSSANITIHNIYYITYIIICHTTYAVASIRRTISSSGLQDVHYVYINISRIPIYPLSCTSTRSVMHCNAVRVLYLFPLIIKNDKFTVYRIFPEMGVTRPFIYTRWYNIIYIIIIYYIKRARRYEFITSAAVRIYTICVHVYE